MTGFTLLAYVFGSRPVVAGHWGLRTYLPSPMSTTLAWENLSKNDPNEGLSILGRASAACFTMLESMWTSPRACDLRIAFAIPRSFVDIVPNSMQIKMVRKLLEYGTGSVFEMACFHERLRPRSGDGMIESTYLRTSLHQTRPDPCTPATFRSNCLNNVSEVKRQARSGSEISQFRFASKPDMVTCNLATK